VKFKNILLQLKKDAENGFKNVPFSWIVDESFE
jgi:hypothetical protein